MAAALAAVTLPGAAQRGAAPPLHVQTAAADVVVKQITYEQLDGTRNAATLVAPADGRGSHTPHPAILFLHWYEPPKVNSNRTEFLPEAIELAARGTVSLLIDTPWRQEGWFQNRDASHDLAFTQQETKDVRRALDLLLQQPHIDARRVAIVGHDFGAMFGAMEAADDPRVTHLVYMAGAPTFAEWWLFAPKREGAERDALVKSMEPYQPVRALASLGSRPVLLQFGTKDRFVSNEAATQQADAVTGPKTVKMYDGAEHELRYEATRDRVAWIEEQFKLK